MNGLIPLVGIAALAVVAPASADKGGCQLSRGPQPDGAERRAVGTERRSIRDERRHDSFVQRSRALRDEFRRVGRDPPK